MASRASIIGAQGEDIAVKWLRQRGFMIVHRNWRDGRYELDIVARKGFSLHFVEVKTRSKGGWSSPEDAITEDKFNALLHAAKRYLASHPTPLEPQFDLIAVEIEPQGETEVRYVPNAMQTHW